MITREGYEIFVRNLEQIEEGKEFEGEIRDARTCQVKVVKAVIASSAEKLPEGEPLWVRALVGHLLVETPWRIKILQILKEV